jgi:arylsulfatase A-like enzyme
LRIITPQLLFLSLLAGAGTAQQAKPPNVIFIVLDDFNSWTGALGVHPNAKTPNLDRFAASGIHFRNAHCPSPLCGPSRASVMSGIRPSTSGVYGNTPKLRERLPDAVTLTQHFKGEGYYVAGAGKIFHGGQNGGEGWDRYQFTAADPVFVTKDKKPRPFGWGAMPVTDEEMGDSKVLRFAEQELAKQHDQPFFLALGLYKPHLPWKAPQKYFDMHPIDRIKINPILHGDLNDVPEVAHKFATEGVGYNSPAGGDHKMITRYDNHRQAVQGYLATCSFADAIFGRILDAIERSAYADDSIIVVWSDHGWHLGEKLHWRKHALWRLATQSLLMVSGPGIVPGEREQAVSLLDIYPTLISLAGMSERPELEGRDLSPLIHLDDPGWNKPVLVTFGRGNHSVISNQWHLIRYHDGSRELYHLDDRYEWFNLAGGREFLGVNRILDGVLPRIEAPGEVFVGEGEESIPRYRPSPGDPGEAEAGTDR